jgi:hypothetical protein
LTANVITIFGAFIEALGFFEVLPQELNVPDRRSRILEVVIVRCLATGVLGIWRGEGLGEG